MLALLPVFNSWAFLETRRLVQVFPEHVRKLWNNWELRVLVLVSLTLQLCLLHFGSRRRYSVKTWLRVILWLSYLGADSVATIALGVISNILGNSCDGNDSRLQNELMAFWAPFLLLHLGGQDTITAYAVQDNELWLRHLLGLVVQSGAALYILLLSWKVSWLSFLTIPMFLAGLIKYAERTWALKSANYDLITAHLEVLQLNLGRRAEELVYEGWAENLAYASPYDISAAGEAISGVNDPKILKYAFMLFGNFRCLLRNRKVSEAIFLRDGHIYFRDSKTAWKTIEVELGYAYDVYYTKAPMFFTAWGSLFRFFSFTSALFAFMLLIIKDKHKYPQIDLIITYLLLVGSILVEIYAVILLSASDWPLRRYDNELLQNCIKTLFTPIRNGCAKLTSKQRWSNSMGQLNLLGSCLQGGIFELFIWREWKFNLFLLLYTTHQPVSDNLKELVFDTLRSPNGNGFLDEYITNGDETARVETYQRIIIWHIATDLCFYTESGANERDIKRRRMSKDVSDYMMYILEMCPLDLPRVDAIRGFVRARELVSEYLQRKRLSGLSKAEVCQGLISGFEDLVPAEVCQGLISGFIDLGHDVGRHLLFIDELLPFAVQVANKLKGQNDGKWKILSEFWVGNLAYVATLCQGHNHAQLLGKGGEFLTHVWFLKEHFNHIRSFQEP